MNLGVMLPNWIGDVAMATPALRALRRHFGPRASITGILRPYVADVLAGTPWLNDAILFDQRASESKHRSWHVLRELRSRQFDVLLLFTNSLRTAAVAWLSGAKQRVGYSRYGRRWLLNRALEPPREGNQLAPISAVDYYLELAYAVGCPHESPHLELATLSVDEQAADEVWRDLGLAAAERVVVLNTGAAAGSAKHWPVEHFAALARRIVDQTDAAVLVVCGPAERAAAAQIERRAQHRLVTSLADRLPDIGLTKACIRRSQLVVTTDSGPRHFAAALDVPVVALFGPTDPRWADNHHPREIQLRQELPCSPCGKKVCPLGHHRCMRELSVERVFAAVQKQLAIATAVKAA